MAFSNLEESIEDGRPIYLYRFSLNDKVWRYTSADDDLTVGGFTWTGVPISDDGVKQTGDVTTDALTISTTTGIVPVQLYMTYPPAQPVQLAIFRGHEGDSEIKAIYVGEVTQCAIPYPGAARLTCETFSATMQREGLRLGWQRNCPYALYDPVTCKVNKMAHQYISGCEGVVGNVIWLPNFEGQPDGKFRGGFVEWTDPVRGIERRAVENNVGGSFSMFGSSDGIVFGTVIYAYPGCARTVAACQSFNNFDNYGGVPKMQGKSPFDGNPVFY